MDPRARFAIGTLRVLTGCPSRLQRLLAGPAVLLDAQELDLETQLMLRWLGRGSGPPLESLPLPAARAKVAHEIRILAGQALTVERVQEITIPTAGGSIGARLYAPRAGPDAVPLLVYFHGGGFVVADLDTHDNTCRFLARHGRLMVLSIDYRRAPEHPFPAAVDDALAAFTFAVDHARELGADAGAIAVGGDSAGGNLAAVVCRQRVASGRWPPVFQLLLYPMTDLSRRRRSYALFGDGFGLTQGQMDWFQRLYLTAPEQALDERASPLLAEDLRGVPPAYVATAGFDVLRDEGEEYAGLLAAAGTAVTLHRHRGLAHGFATALGVSRAAAQALSQALGGLRVGIALGRSQRG